MSHIEFMAYLQELATKDPDNPIKTKHYSGHAGAEILIKMPLSVWGYVDWLEERGDIDFATWVRHCEQTPFEDWPISQLLMYWLWRDECCRHRNGEPTPTNVPPEGYEPYGERSNDNLSVAS